MPVKVHDARWQALARETALGSRLLGTGLGGLRRAEASHPGLYYEGFFGITIGIERLCKLVIVVSDYIASGDFPTDADLKNSYGHDLSRLVQEVSKRIDDGVVSTKWPVPTDAEHADVMAFLTDFAKLSRYYNLGALAAGAKSGVDPIPRWFDLVLKHRPQRPLTKTQQRNLAEFAMMDDVVGHMVHIMHSDEHGGLIDNFVSGATHGITVEHVQRAGTLMCINVARPIASALASLSYAHAVPGDELPVFSEFLYMFLNDDSFLRNRKTFNYPR